MEPTWNQRWGTKDAMDKRWGSMISGWGVWTCEHLSSLSNGHRRSQSISSTCSSPRRTRPHNSIPDASCRGDSQLPKPGPKPQKQANALMNAVSFVQGLAICKASLSSIFLSNLPKELVSPCCT
eukprot:5497948-Amphidinium_carterae.1